MLKFPYKTWLLAGILALLPWAAHAAGLGQLRILSALGQPLLAEVDLISVRKDELATLAARLAAPEAFSQARIQYSPALVGARLSIEKRADGRPYIRITSARPVNEPFIDLLIELSWAQGRLVREYTALIDPPSIPSSEPSTAVVVVPPTAVEARPITPVAPTPGVAVAPVAPRAKPSARASAAARGAPAGAAGSEYGPVKKGETLGRIAANVKPEGVTLEQMLVSLYRSNPDAFAGNINRLKTGRILRVPEKDQVSETSQPEAVKEVRVQSANWNSYRQKLAETAGDTGARETTSASRGKIATTVEDKAGTREPAKEVLKLSKGDSSATGKSASGKPIPARERARALEEEATAREKALAEANARIAQLEATIRDMQRLLELKGQVPPKPAVTPPSPAPAGKPVTTPPPKADAPAAPKMEATPPPKAEVIPPPKAEIAPPPKAEIAPPPAPKPEVAPVPPPAPKTDQVVKPDPPKAEPPKDAPKSPEAVKPDAPAVVPAPSEQPKPKPRIVQPPPPAPDLVDQILGEPLYLAAAAALLALLGAGIYMLTRRRTRATDADFAEAGVRTAPNLGRTAPAGAAAAPIVAAPGTVEDVDPLAEADLYLNFGRDAQAEEVLKEALQKNPRNAEAQLKLLQIYATRKDKAAFEKVAKELHSQTGGTGETWMKAAALGFALDAANSLYEAGRIAPATPAVAGAAPSTTDLDFDFELSPTAASKTEVEFDVGAAQKTLILQPGELPDMTAAQDATTETVDITADSGVGRAAAPAGTPAPPDFSLDLPLDASPSEPDITADSPADDVAKTRVTPEAAVTSTGPIDFDFDAAASRPRADAGKGYTHDGTVIMSPENQDKAAELTMDFELGDAPPSLQTQTTTTTTDTTTLTPAAPDFTLDLPTDTAPPKPVELDGIDLSLEDPDKTIVTYAQTSGPKDDHWYDVQTKFDLAKAYQEMGDKEGAREILQEVLKEGDAGQTEEAKKLLEALG